MIWREKRWLLIVLAIILLANTIFFFTYRVQYESRLRDLDTRLDSAKAELEAARRARVGAEQQVAAYRGIERNVRDIYENRWATETQRLTSMIAEVKRLSGNTNLTPTTFNFSRQQNAESGRVTSRGSSTAIGATEVGVSFNVQGTYQQVRRLINQLELSPQFIIIDQLGLSSENGDLLTMNIHVKTLFRDTAAPPGAVNQDL
jgi:hypothetical protein